MTGFLEMVRAESLRMTVGEAIGRVTAFRDVADLQDALDRGYLPTLRVKDEPMGVEEGRDNHAVRLIRRFVIEQGFGYFDGRRVVRA
ncbi:MAG: hypothetical protein MUF18_20175 [Fimbriiglobus sp.]|jgi:hypothetical protein|nr:hypothetical protein [Fimbriiglobus sp.]